ncbi:MAG: PIN domain-containing protein [Myxococcales bacterium]|nr:PIN domain-containing protein [Myxococcales bacterium]
MILVDANLLLYASFAGYPQHDAARTWLESELSRAGRVGLPWDSLLAFVRVASNPRALTSPISVDEAWELVHEFLNYPGVWIPLPTTAHTAALDELIIGRRLTSKLVMDAHLAALAIEHGLTLCSADNDFRRFARVRFVNPIATAA